MINFLKEWKGQIGGLEVRQTAQPMNDGELLHVITGWYVEPFVYFNSSSDIPFADVEKLADDRFRMELARMHVTKRAKELRRAADLAEKALAEYHEEGVRESVRHDELMGRHTP